MKKRLTAIFLTSAIALGSLPVSAAEVSIDIDGLTQINAGTVINRGGYNLLGMRDVFEMLDAEVQWNNVKRCVTAKKDGKTVTLYVDSNRADVDGKKLSLPTGCVNLDGHIYVPIRFVSDAFDYKIDWDQNRQRISIDTGVEKYVLLDVTPDITDSTLVLTYEEALKKATDNNSSLKDLDDSVAYLEDMRSDLGDMIWSLDQMQHQYNSALFDMSQQTNDVLSAQLALQENIESTIQVARNIKNVDIQKQMVSVNEEMVTDGVELALKSYINNIKSTSTQIELLEETVKLGKENIENLELKNKLGYESDYNLQTAKTTQTKNENNLEVLKLNLENEKQALKTHLGVDASQDIYVECEVTFDALADVNLNQYVDRKRETDPSIKTQKNNVTLAEYKMRTNAAYDSENEIGVRNELNTAKRNLDDAKNTLEKNIRTTYNSIKQLEENNKSLLASVEQAKADYNSVVASYKAGLATAYQVKQAKLGILSAEKAVEDNALNYDLLTFSFERPYLLGSTSK